MGVVVDGRQAALLLGLLAPGLSEYRRAGLVLPERDQRLLIELEQLREVHYRGLAAGSGSGGIPAEGAGEMVSSWMSTTEAATVLQCSARNVRGLKDRGTLEGRRVGRALQISSASVHAETLRRKVA